MLILKQRTSPDPTQTPPSVRTSGGRMMLERAPLLWVIVLVLPILPPDVLLQGGVQVYYCDSKATFYKQCKQRVNVCSGLTKGR